MTSGNAGIGRRAGRGPIPVDHGYPGPRGLKKIQNRLGTNAGQGEIEEFSPSSCLSPSCSLLGVVQGGV